MTTLCLEERKVCPEKRKVIYALPFPTFSREASQRHRVPLASRKLCRGMEIWSSGGMPRADLVVVKVKILRRSILSSSYLLTSS